MATAYAESFTSLQNILRSIITFIKIAEHKIFIPAMQNWKTNFKNTVIYNSSKKRNTL